MKHLIIIILAMLCGACSSDAFTTSEGPLGLDDGSGGADTSMGGEGSTDASGGSDNGGGTGGDGSGGSDPVTGGTDSGGTDTGGTGGQPTGGTGGTADPSLVVSLDFTTSDELKDETNGRDFYKLRGGALCLTPQGAVSWTGSVPVISGEMYALSGDVFALDDFAGQYVNVQIVSNGVFQWFGENIFYEDLPLEVSHPFEVDFNTDMGMYIRNDSPFEICFDNIQVRRNE